MDDTVKPSTILKTFTRFSVMCGFAVMLTGTSVLVGWALGIGWLKSVYADITMKPNAALALALSGFGLFVLFAIRDERYRRGVATICGAVVLLLGALTLSQYITRIDLGIDQLLFLDDPDPIATASPGRMGVPASTSFILCGASLLLLTFEKLRASQSLAFTAAVIALLPITGVAYGAFELFGIAGFTAIALHTAIALLLLSLGLVFARPEAGWVSLLTGTSPANIGARRLMVGAIAIPFVLGWVQVLLKNNGYVDIGLGSALLAVAMTVVFVALVLWNASRLVEAEDALEDLLARERAAHAEVESASLLKDEFLATLSHELRNPLNAILGWSQLMSNRKLDEETMMQACETIHRNALSQGKMIGDILEVSRIISGKLRLDLREVMPINVITAALESVRPTAEAKGVRLQSMLDPLAGPVTADSERLQQVFWNLLSNAIKFTPRGGRVQIRLERVNSHVEISVSDTGVGIPADFLPHVFERFRQADGSSTRLHGGLGLGLAIVRQLVELHGGTVHAESPGANQGARFVVQLPTLAAISQAEGPVERTHPSVDESIKFDYDATLTGCRVLVVEDERDSREMLGVILEKCGAEVRMVESVDLAIEEFQRSKPDVVVSDIGIPQKDGYELIKNLRELESGSEVKTPALALTAYARVDDRVKLLSAGFQMHLAKPLHAAELVAAVASLYNHRAR